MVINKHDKKQRPQVGIQDIDKYEFGGLEIDNFLTNGYQLYIPYGIHCDIFKAIQDSIQLMRNQRYECKEIIETLYSDMEKIEEKHKNVYSYTIQVQQENIKRIDANLKILEKIEPLINKI